MIVDMATWRRIMGLDDDMYLVTRLRKPNDVEISKTFFTLLTMPDQWRRYGEVLMKKEFTGMIIELEDTVTYIERLIAPGVRHSACQN